MRDRMTLDLGDLKIHRIVDMEAPLAPITELLADLSPHRLDALRGDFLPGELDPQDNLNICFQSFLVTCDGLNILIDSCVGEHKHQKRAIYHQRTDSPFLRNLRRLGYGPEDIHFVMCTHLHADHAGWNTQLSNGRWVPTFPNARYIFGAREYEHWIDRHAVSVVTTIEESVLPIIEAGRADLVGDDFELGNLVRVMPTPGHTPGHASIRVGAGRDVAVITGDIFHSAFQVRHPEFSFAADFDKALAATTRRGFLDRFCDTETICCSSHSPVAPFSRITPWRDAFQCCPLP